MTIKFAPIASPTPTPTPTPAKKPRNVKAKLGRPKTGAAKEQVSIRLDQAILAHYRAFGDGWQSKLNDDLLKLIS